MKNIIKTNEIPDIPLYMDQIIQLLDDKLENHKTTSDDKILTKTMINNYSKEGLIYKVKGKTYTKHQIIQMLLVYYLKNGLSMQEIKQLLIPIYDSPDQIISLYEQFLDNQERRQQQLNSLLSSLDNDPTLQVLELVELSNELLSIAKSKIK